MWGHSTAVLLQITIVTATQEMNKSHTPSVDSAESASLRETIGVLQERVREAERRAGRAESASREAETTVQTVLQTVEDTRKVCVMYNNAVMFVVCCLLFVVIYYVCLYVLTPLITLY